ncbi:hypothetical protein SAMN05216229_11547 [Geopseudomonas sagittaria]|uniref:Uncharacterized protein n=1 Tax=Geopseudomonas sagittaria TaxID=1135990 RepID=A0A1I5X700_9GAMM|nr:hypothetical protein [Pseudomonas sagittaria]SFQ27427.1 hypothetical protein SAMN05216229_11547 [Pseudomonas sagittaria]
MDKIKISADGLGASDIAQALLGGKDVNWCACVSAVAAELEENLGKSSRRITDEFMGSDSWCGGISYDFLFESGAILKAWHIGDWHGHMLSLDLPG